MMAKENNTVPRYADEMKRRLAAAKGKAVATDGDDHEVEVPLVRKRLARVSQAGTSTAGGPSKKARVETKGTPRPGTTRVSLNANVTAAGLLSKIRGSSLNFEKADDLAEAEGYRIWADHMVQVLASTNALVDSYDQQLKLSGSTGGADLGLTKEGEPGQIAGSGGQATMKALEGLREEVLVLKKRLSESADHLKMAITERDSAMAWAETEVNRAKVLSEREINHAKAEVARLKREKEKSTRLPAENARNGLKARYAERFAKIRQHLTEADKREEVLLMTVQAKGTLECLEYLIKQKGVVVPADEMEGIKKDLSVFEAQLAAIDIIIWVGTTLM